MAKNRIWCCLLVVLLSLSAGPYVCAKIQKKIAYKDVLIENVPHVRQKSDFCGEACAEMYLRKLGKNIDQDCVFDQSGIDPLKARGCHTSELAKALKKIGFRVGDVWYKVAASKADKQIETQFDELHDDLVKGKPSIVCMHYDDEPGTTEHFRLVVGYDSKKDEVIYHEPAEIMGAYQRMKRKRFLKLWPLKYDKKQWTIIRIRLQAGRIKNFKPADGFTDADYSQHIMKLKRKIPDKAFTVLIQKPFVIIGDESPSMVRRRSVSTIKWATDKLKKDYFKKDPDKIIDVWLFKDKKSYEKYTRKIFKDKPDTPFGYFSHTHNSLIMNIATGGGTLVHEMVHPFIDSNFSECPAWFNEGLASLYEQCRENKGHINGLTNWRLAGLQKGIRAGGIPSFKTLTHSSTHKFYNSDKGNNYAQARYLCYYLQEKGLLIKYYHQFHDNHKKDPTGFETLKKVLGKKDIEAFQKQWEKFILKLTFP
ncbi:MAG: hypothetical protein FVQ82_12350 [Planctomycetes bacterium]|nr:hypothetical protein [Planctomycetota bacterium]